MLIYLERILRIGCSILAGVLLGKFFKEKF